MDTIIKFPTADAARKPARPSAEKWTATLAEERRRLQEDHDSLRERESNLREYEARLRMLQAEIEAGRTVPPIPVAKTAVPETQDTVPLRVAIPAPQFQRPSSRAPFGEDPALQAAWEKLHRARELLEAEQKNLRDDRNSLRELETMLKQRMEEIAEREAVVAQREGGFVAAPLEPIPEGEPEVSGITRFTRSVFGGRRVS